MISFRGGLAVANGRECEYLFGVDLIRKLFGISRHCVKLLKYYNVGNKEWIPVGKEF